MPYASTPAATRIRNSPVQVKNTERLKRTRPFEMPHEMTTAVRMPSTAPSVPSTGSLPPDTFAQTKRAVSTPSRPTDRAPSTTMAIHERSIAASIWPRSSFERPAPCVPIQKIIHVTIATATSESTPPSTSCAWNVSA